MLGPEYILHISLKVPAGVDFKPLCVSPGVELFQLFLSLPPALRSEMGQRLRLPRLLRH